MISEKKEIILTFVLTGLCNFDFSAILFGITNTVGNLPGFIGTATAGRILDHMDGLSGWRTIFGLGGEDNF